MNLMYVIRRCLTLFLIAFWAVQLLAQANTTNPRETALRYLKEHAADMGLSVQDVADLKVTRIPTGIRLDPTNATYQRALQDALAQAPVPLRSSQ